CLHHFAVRTVENNRNLWIAVIYFLGECDAIHTTRHCDIAEHEINISAGLQLIECVRGILCAHREIPELFYERSRDLGDLGAVFDNQNGPQLGYSWWERRRPGRLGQRSTMAAP